MAPPAFARHHPSRFSFSSSPLVSPKLDATHSEARALAVERTLTCAREHEREREKVESCERVLSAKGLCAHPGTLTVESRANCKKMKKN